MNSSPRPRTDRMRREKVRDGIAASIDKVTQKIQLIESSTHRKTAEVVPRRWWGTRQNWTNDACLQSVCSWRKRKRIWPSIRKRNKSWNMQPTCEKRLTKVFESPKSLLNMQKKSEKQPIYGMLPTDHGKTKAHVSEKDDCPQSLQTDQATIVATMMTVPYRYNYQNTLPKRRDLQELYWITIGASGMESSSNPYHSSTWHPPKIRIDLPNRLDLNNDFVGVDYTWTDIAQTPCSEPLWTLWDPKDDPMGGNWRKETLSHTFNLVLI